MTREIFSDLQTHIILFAASIALDLFLVHEWLGLPWIPATATNDFWELVVLDMKLGFFILLLFIPSLVAVYTVMLVSHMIVWILSAAYFEVKP